mgnify:CR=1 FL=1
MGPAQTIETLLSTLGGDGLFVYADKVLEALGDASVPYLIDALKNPSGKDPLRCQRLSVMVLGRLKAKEAVQPLRDMLREALSTRDTELGAKVVIALGQIGDTSALPELLAAAQSTDFHQQVNAAQGLEYLGDPRAEPLLLELLTNHPDPNIRYSAARALSTFGTASAIPVLEQRLQLETNKGTWGQIRTTLQTLRQKAR